VQQTLLAREFARRGYDVSMVVKDYGQPQGEVIDGIRCFKSYADGQGLPVLRFIYPKMYTLWQALSMADADVYYQSCASFLTGLTARYARRHGKTFLFRVAHDTDCIPGQHLITYKRDVMAYEYGLRGASVISAQSRYQQDLLRDNYGLDSLVMNMLVEEEKPGEARHEKDLDVLWVNNIRPIKRPDVLLEVVKALPDLRFAMAGGLQDGHHDYYREIEAGAKRLPNLEFMGAVPYARIGSIFSRANLFLNTSDSEGFPNTFLQSWIRGIPVVSFFDPDGIIQRDGLGASPGSLEEMVAVIKAYFQGDAPVAWMENARKYIAENHSSKMIVDVHLRLFKEYGI